tara:strand:- start:77 stop:355 length:279 start_codon:yes stop_codon:yes gene_type:complete
MTDSKKLCNWCDEMLTPDYFETPKPYGTHPDYNYCDGCLENEMCASGIHHLLDEILKLRNFRENIVKFNCIELCDDCGEIVGSDCDCDSDDE